MNVHEAIQTRRSVRAFRSAPVPEDVLERILEAVRIAPSAKNRQPWKLIVVTDPNKRTQLAAAAKNQRFVGQAPVVIAAVGLHPERVMSCGTLSDPVDVSIALDHLSLAAVEEGLGTCWIGAFDQEAAREILEVPDPLRIVVMMILGYPADTPGKKNRKPIGEILCREQFR